MGLVVWSMWPSKCLGLSSTPVKVCSFFFNQTLNFVCAFRASGECFCSSVFRLASSMFWNPTIVIAVGKSSYKLVKMNAFIKTQIIFSKKKDLTK